MSATRSPLRSVVSGPGLVATSPFCAIATTDTPQRARRLAAASDSPSHLRARCERRPSQLEIAGGVYELVEELETCRVVRVLRYLVAPDHLGIVLHFANRVSEYQQRAAEDLNASFHLRQDRLVRPQRRERPRTFARRGPRDDVEVGREATRRGDDDSSTVGSSGNGDDEGARPVQPRVFQDLGVRGVAEQRVHAGRLQSDPRRRDRSRRPATVLGAGPSTSAMCRPTRPQPTMTTWSCRSAGRPTAVGPRRSIALPERRHPPQPAFGWFDQPEHQRVEGDRDQGACEDQRVCDASSSPSPRPACPTMNENSPIWLRPAATTRAVRGGCARTAIAADEAGCSPSRRRTSRRTAARPRTSAPRGSAGSTKHPAETKKSTANASRNGSRSAPTWWPKRDSLDEHARDECAERQRDPEAAADVERRSQSDHQRRRAMKSSRGTGPATRAEPGHDACRRPTQHQPDEEQRLADRPRGRALIRPPGAASRDDRQQHEDHDSGDVFETSQPTAT